MDSVEHLPEVQLTEPGVQDIHPGPEYAALRPLVLRDLEHVGSIVSRYERLGMPREDPRLFRQHLWGRSDSWFLEYGDDEGLVFFTSIIPRFRADFGVVFWDAKMPKTRYAPMREALHAAFDMFELQRIQAQVSAKNVGLNRNLRRLGFVWEGTLRRGWIGTNGYFHDLCILGMLREDLTSGR